MFFFFLCFFFCVFITVFVFLCFFSYCYTNYLDGEKILLTPCILLPVLHWLLNLFSAGAMSSKGPIFWKLVRKQFCLTLMSSLSNDSIMSEGSCILFNPFPNKPWFLLVCSAGLLKTLWEKEKLLLMSNFSFSFSIMYRFGELSAIILEFKIVSCEHFESGRV